VTRGDFHQALIQEIAFSKQVLTNSGIQLGAFKSIFFGGGTPSLLAVDQISDILTALRDTHGIEPGAEITLEANPDTVDGKYLEQLYSAGINRVSFGVQSFDREVLKTLDRTHNPQAVPEVVELAKSLGLRVSIDLIFGAPGESLDSWRRSVQSALDLGTEHISAYSLIVEPGTKLAARIKRGELQSVDEDLNAEKYEIAAELIESAGLKCYEVSNFGSPSVHNNSYWYSRNWWGFGPGAHSHIQGNRFWNRKHPAAYQASLTTGSPAQGREVIEHRTHLEERLLLELRCTEGTELSLLTELDVSREKVAKALADNLLTLLPGSRIAVTDKGRLLIDGVVLQLLT
jgi:oxygen-independent coproporphyrinogen-3 oxidase